MKIFSRLVGRAAVVLMYRIILHGCSLIFDTEAEFTRLLTSNLEIGPEKTLSIQDPGGGEFGIIGYVREEIRFEDIAITQILLHSSSECVSGVLIFGHPYSDFTKPVIPSIGIHMSNEINFFKNYIDS